MGVFSSLVFSLSPLGVLTGPEKREAEDRGEWYSTFSLLEEFNIFVSSLFSSYFLVLHVPLEEEEELEKPGI